MNEYRQKAINHLKTHLGCVGYRDYLVTELEKLDKIEQIIKEWKESAEWDIEMHDTLDEIINVLDRSKAMNNAQLMLEVNRLSTIEKLQKENKILNDKIEKIKQIVNEEIQIVESDLLWKIKEVLEDE